MIMFSVTKSKYMPKYAKITLFGVVPCIGLGSRRPIFIGIKGNAGRRRIDRAGHNGINIYCTIIIMAIGVNGFT